MRGALDDANRATQLHPKVQSNWMGLASIEDKHGGDGSLRRSMLHAARGLDFFPNSADLCEHLLSCFLTLIEETVIKSGSPTGSIRIPNVSAITLLCSASATCRGIERTLFHCRQRRAVCQSERPQYIQNFRRNQSGNLKEPTAWDTPSHLIFVVGNVAVTFVGEDQA